MGGPKGDAKGKWSMPPWGWDPWSCGGKGWGPYGWGFDGWGFDGWGGKGYKGSDSKGCGKAEGRSDHSKSITARYLLNDISEEITEDRIREYFGAFCEIEEVTLRKVESNGKVMGSVKFAAPTMELREQMLKEKHEIDGHEVSVQTWKMQKMQKPGYQAKMAEENARFYAERWGASKGWGKGWGPWGPY